MADQEPWSVNPLDSEILFSLMAPLSAAWRRGEEKMQGKGVGEGKGGRGGGVWEDGGGRWKGMC